MLRHTRLFGVFVFVLGFTGSVWGQNFSDVVVFGDSQSDPGNAAPFLGQRLGLELPEGSSFTTNPDPVWAEIVAATFRGKQGGHNYAFAGACVNPDTPCDQDSAPTVTEQIGAYLASRDGRADPNALYAVWGGGNDVTDSLTNASIAMAVDHISKASEKNVALIQDLQKAGARHILVFNLPDISHSPYAMNNLPPPVQALLRMQSMTYNDELHTGIRELEDGIIPINVFRLFDELIENPGTYGFTDTTGTACGEPDAMEAVSIICGPGYPVPNKSGDNQQYLFADRSHPSGATHEILASLVTATLAAPVQVSLAGEGGVEIAGLHRSAVSDEWTQELELDRLVGSWRAYVTGRIGQYKLDALPRLGSTQADVSALTLGANHRAGTNLWWGAALSFGRYDNDAADANLDSLAVIGSLNAMWRRDGFYVSGALSGGNTWVDVNRSITLGSTVRVEDGSTSAGQYGAALDAGWILDLPYGLQHGPFFGLAWLDQTVDGYRESGALSTAMNFSGFDRASLIARAGYRVMRTLVWDHVGFRPYANLAFAKEFKDDPISVTASSNTDMPGRFTLSGFTPPRQWGSTDLGLVVSLNETMSGFAGYSGRFGTEDRQDHRLSLGLGMTF